MSAKDVMRAQHPTDFEAAVLQWISATTDDQAVRQQLSQADVLDRDYTVVGCYSRLAVPSDAPVSTATHLDRGFLRGPYFESKVVEHGGGTVLWFKGGRASRLEIYAHGDYFPADHSELGQFKLSSGA